MALVVITIQDKADGSIDVNLNNEPRIPQDGAMVRQWSQAEKLGAVALNAIHAQLQEEQPHIIITLDAAKNFETVQE